MVGLPSTKRPNILVIEADDMRSDDLPWMPNVRRLIGGAGLTFENSFAPYPLCCPSRASFLTGKYAHNHHVLSHVKPWGFHAFDDHLTIATQLQAAGYDTALVGKYLNGYGDQPTKDGLPSLTYVPPGWTDWLGGTDHHWAPGDTRSGGTYSYFHLTQNINGRIVEHPDRYTTDVTAQQTRALAAKYVEQKKPFFIWWTPVAPHFGYPIEPDDPTRVIGPGGKRVDFATPARPDWVKGHFDARITHALGTPPDHSAEADVSDKPRWMQDYTQLTASEKAGLTQVTRQRAESLFVLDREIGRTIAALQRNGSFRHTIIAFTSDNGYYLGEHLKRLGKVKLHEPSLRVPFLIAGPGIPHGRRYDPITSIDIAPTIAGFAGLSGMPQADGVDLRPVIKGGDRGWTRPVLMETLMAQYPHTAPALGFATRLNVGGLRLGRWKLTTYSSGEFELYDLLRDPLELTNLARLPRFKSRLDELRRLWHRTRECAGVSCARALPRDLALTPAQERQLTDNQTRRTRSWFDN